MAKKKGKKNKKEEKVLSGKNAPSLQKHLDIAEIKDDMVIMRDGSVRAVMIVSSVNFDLKSEEEQNAMVGSYVNFLNSLSFPIQVVIQSRPLNIDSYLDRLNEAEREQTNELLRMQIADYRNFVTELLELESIMSKKFFVVISYNPAHDQKQSYMDRLVGAFSIAKKVVLSAEKYDTYSRELTKRSIFIAAGLTSMGLQVQRLNTQALIELYYNSYNPALSQSQPLEDINKLSIN